MTADLQGGEPQADWIEPRLGPPRTGHPVDAEHEQRRAARLIQRQAYNAEDADQLMRMLGIRPDVFRVQWARTVALGAGFVTFSVDVDLRTVRTEDAEFIARMVSIVNEFAEKVRDV